MNSIYKSATKMAIVFALALSPSAQAIPSEYKGTIQAVQSKKDAATIEWIANDGTKIDNFGVVAFGVKGKVLSVRQVQNGAAAGYESKNFEKHDDIDFLVLQYIFKSASDKSPGFTIKLFVKEYFPQGTVKDRVIEVKSTEPTRPEGYREYQYVRKNALVSAPGTRIVLEKAQVILKDKAHFTFGNFKFYGYAPGKYFQDSPADVILVTDIVPNLVKTK